ncbi:hypothetical protein TorRG33x02_313020 [Trema orientale]|uniref:Uncharacterized protein n=1 Tax=Trema orientale TaxID=63057 RepID=A0A2P5BPR0_TREOI|nr:hypothetical protein TorRG33x02_313020 [Trema orientale]
MGVVRFRRAEVCYLQRPEMLRDRGLAAPEARTRALLRRVDVLAAERDAATAEPLLLGIAHEGHGVAAKDHEFVMSVREREGAIFSQRDVPIEPVHHVTVLIIAVIGVADEDAHGGVLDVDVVNLSAVSYIVSLGGESGLLRTHESEKSSSLAQLRSSIPKG